MCTSTTTSSTGENKASRNQFAYAIRPTAVVVPEFSSHLSNQLPLSITRQIAALRLFPYWALIIVNEPPGHFFKFKTSPHMTCLKFKPGLL